ncbi:MAG: hypothetical protein JOZ99_11335 [Actinobacteria bacterium]|nr:hypothetical protein [Actinomycetota bacterium]
MAGSSNIETDYLVVGAGALGMGFVDTLIEHSDADVVMVERRHRPGGHWLDSYPFVQLHQPSMNYGVNSTRLGQDRVEDGGLDRGFYERASGAEICGYYDEIMRHRFLASGRVRFFPMCDYTGEGRFRSRVTGADVDVTVRCNTVDATYMETRVPATDGPPFGVADGVTCIPVGALTRLTEPAAGYVIIGAGKTAIDAVSWLLDQRVAPEDITWIRPRDTWILNRRYFQPGDGVVPTFEGVVLELEAVAACDSIEQVYEELEAHDVVMRLDRAVQPSMLKGATSSAGEVDALRRVENVVRLGRVRQIERDAIVLDEGSIPTTSRHVHVHCASHGLSDKPPVPIFGAGTITLQVITRVSLSLSAGLIGFVEASGRPAPEKNRLCRPNAWPHTPFDWARHLLTGMKTEMEWPGAPDVVEWVEASRLNLVRGLEQDPDEATVAGLQSRFLTALFPALEKLDKFAAAATPAERARIFEPRAEAPV